ncbi:MAG TPA: hypothetical protein VGN34_19030 [Ktedonobacteraceae bacterium]
MKRYPYLFCFFESVNVHVNACPLTLSIISLLQQDKVWITSIVVIHIIARENYTLA